MKQEEDRDSVQACKKNACNELKEKVLRLEEEKKALMDREARGEARCKMLVEDVNNEKEYRRLKIGELQMKIMELEREKRNANALVELYKRRDTEMGARVSHLENEVEILLADHCPLPSNEMDVGDTITTGCTPSVDSDDEDTGDLYSTVTIPSSSVSKPCTTDLLCG